ncbi:hypothetical protein OG205_08745 [Lentzea sp. NBC_00516]|uniref:hypothetical protein n=1 Tax=Lentzea sp. NBC_00516 TaxID=2903582 RepID=UPI002E82057A|nr:hypothetical protein [Lentzea sp. NBC_00516]WUD27066.1 hypothetical protein OG205_08745 [Lentzea sp. NBC_00516]
MSDVDGPRLREAMLRHLVRSAPGQPVSEMAQEVLSGRMTMSAAAGSLAYRDLFATAAAEAPQLLQTVSPAELAEAEQTLAVAATLLDPPVLPEPVRPRPAFEDEWDDSVTSPWDES